MARPPKNLFTALRTINSQISAGKAGRSANVLGFSGECSCAGWIKGLFPTKLNLTCCDILASIDRGYLI